MFASCRRLGDALLDVNFDPIIDEPCDLISVVNEAAGLKVSHIFIWSVDSGFS